MSIFDFFRKKELVEEVKVESFEDAEKVFKEKSGVLKKREGEILVEIGGKFEEFYVSVEEKLRVLEGVDIESRKEYKRAKILVRQGLDKYVGFVRGLLKGLRALEKESLVEFVGEVGKVFVGFEKASAKTYERATYLIGDEMMAVRNEIRRFYNGLLKMFEEEEDLIGDLRKVKDVRLKLGEVVRVESRLKDLEREVLVNEDGVKRLKEKVVGLREEVEKIRGSGEYISYLKLKDEVGVLSNRIEREILKLKGLIDFKRVIGIVHVNERELGIVKRYRDGFVSEFSLDNGKRLIGILKDCGMMSLDVVEQVLVIENLSEELGSVEGRVGIDVLGEKLEEIGKVDGEVEVKMVEGVKVRSRVREVSVRLDGLKDEVVLGVRELGVGG